MSRFNNKPYLRTVGEKVYSDAKRLIPKARAGDQRAAQALRRDWGIRVYTQAEIDALVARRPELRDPDAVLGHDYWDAREPIRMR